VDRGIGQFGAGEHLEGFLAGVALRTGGRRVWHCWESRRPAMRNELSTIPGSGQCDPTSPAPPARVPDWLATCAPPHATSRGASRRRP
jgi:hypothetical protein